MRISFFVSALLLGLVSWNATQSQVRSSGSSEIIASRALLSAQTEQKEDVEPHRGSGRRRFHGEVLREDLGEFGFYQS